MGDAEAEHLLLAGKTLSHVRRIWRVGVDEAVRRRAREILNIPEPGADGLDEKGSVAVDEEDGEGVPTPRQSRSRTSTATTLSRKAAAGSSNASNTPRSPTLPSAPGSPNKIRSVPATPRHGRTAAHRALLTTPSSARSLLPGSPDRTPGGTRTGIDSLMRAAMSVESADGGDAAEDVSGAREQPHASPSQSAKRRRITSGGAGKEKEVWVPSSGRSLRMLSETESGGEDRLGGASTSTAGPAKEDASHLSALDVLADQAFSQSQSQSEHSASTSPVRKPGAPVSMLSVPGLGGLGPSFQPYSEHDEEGGVYIPGMKRVRSPYLKWNLSEDELLVKSIIAHGQRWDLVAAGVPTRTYHQCRQRWLRGLKCELIACFPPSIA
ncbi:hypothetical protein T439DRAFT_177289 [Meredithblackwellia eburnea MCA 4105]